MKSIHIACCLAAFLAVSPSALRAQTPVRVVADRVNLRAKPLLTSEVVAQCQFDDRLQAREIGEEWVEVSAPPSVDLWISKELVQQPANVVSVARANLRAGPSIAYNVVDVLERGASIEPRGEVGDWIKIAPPPSAHVWIHREFVELPSKPAEPLAQSSAENDAKPSRKRKPTPAAETETGAEPPVAETEAQDAPAAAASVAASLPEAFPTPIVSPSVPVRDASARTIPVPPPSDLNLIPLDGQGRLAEFVGELRAAPLINEAPTRYRLVRWQSNRWQVLCHVYGEASKLRSLQDKTVQVKGREFWIQGAAAPVLVPDQIQETPRN